MLSMGFLFQNNKLKSGTNDDTLGDDYFHDIYYNIYLELNLLYVCI